jgi:ribosomal protein L30E
VHASSIHTNKGNGSARTARKYLKGGSADDRRVHSEEARETIMKYAKTRDIHIYIYMGSAKAPER